MIGPNFRIPTAQRGKSPSLLSLLARFPDFDAANYDFTIDEDPRRAIVMAVFNDILSLNTPELE